MPGPLHRRTFLHGLGTAMALPWLEAMTPLARWAEATTEISSPLRSAFLFIPNGVHQPQWAPSGIGKDWVASPLLESLSAVRDDVLVISGLAHHNAKALGDGPGDHARSAACYLTGAHPFKTSGSDIRAGVSVDQIIATATGSHTLLPSLQLGTEGGRQSGNCDSGYSCAYSSNISWQSSDRPIPHETQPRRVFERMFLRGTKGETRTARLQRLARRSSIIDFVLEDAKRLELGLGTEDRRKLDEYLGGVRDIERRIERLEELDAIQQQDESLPDFSAATPSNISEHIRLMHELMIIAFRLDLTRVITFMWANEGSNRAHPHLDVTEGHHTLTHHKGNESQIDQVRKINRWQAEEFAFFVKRLSEVSDGEGTLLDSTVVVHGSAIGDGNRHNHDNLPVLIAGRGNGLIDTGRHLVADKNTPMCNLFLSMAHAAGSTVEQIGDSTGTLPGLRS
ncbi:MAG: DUF1552 domain-containing protein [Planctomycetota bacterium]|nr:DUF1552 domain-containing protein [Planctomycetota bacterium]